MCAESYSQLQAFFPRAYDAAKASACLTKLREAKDCDFYGAAADCGRVFGDVQRSGSAPVGAACQTSADCAASAEGETSCRWVSGAKAAKCQLVVDGAEGAACDGTRWGIATSFVGSGDGDQDKLVICDSAKGLVCGSSPQVCVGLGEPGAACSTSSGCKSQLCSGSKCVARGDLGESCATTGCVEGAYCGDTKVCVERLPRGSACTRLDQCARGACNGGVCDSPKTAPPLGCYSKGD